MGIVIAVASGKGGTGKTSVTGGVGRRPGYGRAAGIVHRHGHRSAESGHLPRPERPGPDGLCRRGPGPLHPVPGRRAPPGPEGAVFTYCSHVPPPQPEPLSGALYAVRRPDAV